MAHKKQTEMFRNNKQFSYLSELMAQQIYPRMLNAMQKLGMMEVRLSKINEWKNICITIDGKIQFFSLDGKTKKDIYQLSFLGQKQCPLFLRDENDSTSEFESPFPKYNTFCTEVLNKLEELEKNFNNANLLIEKIENMGISLERNVIIEKHGKTKK